MKNLYTENLKHQYKNLQRNLVVVHFEQEILPYLSGDVTIYWGMGIYGIEDNDSNLDHLPSDLEDKIIECVTTLFYFYKRELDPVYIYFDILNSSTNKKEQELSESVPEKLNIDEYVLQYM